MQEHTDHGATRGQPPTGDLMGRTPRAIRWLWATAREVCRHPALIPVVALHAVSAALVALLFPHLGPATSILGFAVVLWTGARWGTGAGLASGIAFACTLRLVLPWADPAAAARVFANWHGFGSAFAVAVGAIVGRMADLRRNAEALARLHALDVAALARSQANLSALFERGDAAIWSLDRDLRLRGMNQRFINEFTDMHGHPIALGDRPLDTPGHRANWAALYELALDGKAGGGRVRRAHPSGARHYDVTVHPIRLADGTLDGVAVQAQDVTGEERAVHALAVVIDGAPDAILVHRGGEVQQANHAAAALFGATAAELVGRAVDALVPRRPDPAGLDARGVTRRYATRPDGGRVELESVDLPLSEVSEDGQHTTLAFLRDVSKRAALEARLRLADRLATVGTLAAGVAHEINNPLAFMTTNLDWLDLALPEIAAALPPGQLDEVTRALGEIRDGAARVRTIVRDLSTFAREDDDEVGAVDAHGLLDRTLNLATSHLRRRASVVRDYRATVPARCNEGRLSQVMLNLIVNAAQALPEGTPADHRVTLRTRDLEDGRVELSVTDTGCGIPPEALERVFDPFYTTKPVGVGTGLGLSISRNLINAMGGELHIDSALGVGTTVRVWLPCAATPAPPALVPGPTPRPDARATVLVIDDDHLVARAIGRLLRPHKVEIAVDAAQGLERACNETFDLILCDVQMPGVTGPQLYRALRDRRPEAAARLALMTGGALTDEVAAFLADGGVPVLDKPIDRRSLHELLASRTPIPVPEGLALASA